MVCNYHLFYILGLKLGFLTPKQKPHGLVTPVTAVQTIKSDIILPFYSQPSPALGHSHLKDLCKSAFQTGKTLHIGEKDGSSRLKLDFNKTNNATVAFPQTGSYEQERKMVERKDKAFSASSLAPEVAVQEVFIPQTVTSLKTNILIPGKQEQGATNLGQRRQHTSSCSSTNSAEGSVNAQSRCSVCDGCSSNGSSSPGVGVLLGLENDLHTTARWASKSPEPTSYRLAQMQEDISVLFESVDGVDHQLPQTSLDPTNGKEVP